MSLTESWQAADFGEDSFMNVGDATAAAPPDQQKEWQRKPGTNRTGVSDMEKRPVDANELKEIIVDGLDALKETMGEQNKMIIDATIFAVCKSIDSAPTVMTSASFKAVIGNQEWISVKDRLPETSCSNNQFKQTEAVLAFDGCYVMYGYFKIYIYDGYWQFNGIDDDDFEWRGAGAEVTHWMPLPKPPERDGE